MLSLPPRRRLGARRRPAWVWGLAAALLLMATGALAAYTGAPPWKLFEARPAEPQPAGASSAEARRTKTKTAARRDVEAELPAEAPSVALEAVSAPSEDRPAPAASPRAAARAVEPSAAQLFADANRARASADSAGAIRLYRQLQQRHPRSPEAALSELTLATLLLHTGDARSALSSFDSYLGRGSRPLDAEAMVGRALSLRALGQREQEVAAWRGVIDRYPASSYARRAAERLAALRKP
jgi:TolA-binding protein